MAQCWAFVWEGLVMTLMSLAILCILANLGIIVEAVSHGAGVRAPRWLLLRLLLLVLATPAGRAQEDAYEASKLTAADAAADDYFGISVAVSGDTAVVGARWDGDGGDYSGSAYVFSKQPDGSWSQASKLTAADAAAYDYFGISVAVSGD
eukprot:COSAG02_NODE_11785_length_1654_cov_7.265595_1_plen_149_part_10